MANPQKEDGYTPIANEILEQVCKLKLNGTQFKIIIVVWRFTYGFSRKEHELSETFIAKATKTHKIQLSKELKKLIEMKIIKIVRGATFTSSRIISFNKNYEEWCLNDLQLVSSLTPSNNDNTTASESTNTTASESTNTTVSEYTNQDKKNLKQNLKQNIKKEELPFYLSPVEGNVLTIKFTPDSFEMLCVESIIHSCLELYPNSKVPSTYLEKEKWAIEIERMKRLDSRTEEDIREALNYAINNTFWKGNIRSAKKFREKFETLLIQSKGIKNNNKGQQLQDQFVENMKGWLNDTTGIY